MRSMIALSNLILITGGARSGKSSFAESLAKDYTQTALQKDVVFIATSLPVDEEMKYRIEKHKSIRPENWKVIETYKDFNVYSHKFSNCCCVILDCITTMITNIMFDYLISSNMPYDSLSFSSTAANTAIEIETKIFEVLNELIDISNKLQIPFIIVSNEVGMGMVPDSSANRAFRDIAGRVNQFIAASSNSVYLCISGIPINIK
jgi:adenosylcobinamide kinase / adenosylcobinamide-phosphate guanylyltransferase